MHTSGSIDPHLQSVVKAAESGESLQRIVVVCGSTVYVGVPVSTSKFLFKTRDAFAEEVKKEMAPTWKTSRQEKDRLAAERANDLIAAISPGDQAATPDLLSLSPATVEPPGLTSYEVPALRIHLRQVDAWWIAPFRDHQAKFRGGGVGVGMEF